MNRPLLLLLLLLSGSLLLALQPDFASDPAISPDGNEVCFVYEGDLWLVSFKGGTARQLTATQAQEWGPAWSPDGNYIAFNANREGTNYPYLIPASGGEARLIFAENYTICDWFNDSAHLLVVRYHPNFGNSFFKLPLDGTRPVLLAEIGDRYASLSPDNKSIVFNRYGNPYREAYRGSLAGELWKIDIASKTYTRLTNTDFTERYPRYSHVNNTLFYCASDGERFQIYRADKLDFSRPVKLSNFPQWSARDITIARGSDRLVFELFNEIWKYDPTRLFGDKISKLEINIAADRWQQTARVDKMKNDFYSYAISGDELLLAFQYRYDTFFMPRKGGEVKQITFDHASVSNLEFLEDNRSLVMQRMKNGIDHLFVVKCDSTMAITELDWFGKDSLAVEEIIKDIAGRWTIYYGDNVMSGRVAVADKDLTNIRPLNASRAVMSNVAYNSTGEYAVYATVREDVWIRELWLCDLVTGEHRKLMNDDAWISSLTWTSDDRSLLMTRSGNIFRLDLVPRDEFEYEVDNWKEILAPPPEEGATFEYEHIIEINLAEEDEAEEEGETEAEAELESEPEPEPEPEPIPRKELQIVWEDIEKRLYQVISDPGNTLFVQKVIDDSTFYYISDGFFMGNNALLKKANIYGQNIKQEFDFGNGAGDYKWVGNTIYYILNGTIRSYNVSTGAKREIKAEFDYRYDTRQLNTRVFEQVWGAFGLNFYDANMHGQNWQELFRLYYPYAERARSIQDIASIVNEMIGDVNASHTGFYPRRESEERGRSAAWLGLEFDQSILLPEGIRIGTVYPTSRLATLYKLKSGDILTHIDGVRITPATPVDSLLLDKTGKRIRLNYLSEGEAREAQLTGLSWSENRRLQYEHQVRLARDTVHQKTAGRIGYVHIPGMGSRDYDNFYREVFRDNADKEALIIDVRGNSGGWVHDRIITLLSKRPYGYSTSRRYSGEKNIEPKGGWMKPTIVLVDESSFSDGEIFPIVYKELKLGKVVGMPSSGAVIGTWEYRLLDGSSMRMPGSGWYKLDGTNMEGSGAMPDIIVENTPEDIIAGRDPQLLRAIEEILKELK